MRANISRRSSSSVSQRGLNLLSHVAGSFVWLRRRGIPGKFFISVRFCEGFVEKIGKFRCGSSKPLCTWDCCLGPSFFELFLPSVYVLVRVCLALWKVACRRPWLAYVRPGSCCAAFKVHGHRPLGFSYLFGSFLRIS